VVLHPQLQAVKEVEVVQAAQCEVVWPLLAVRAQHKQAAVALVAEKLQRGLSASLKGLHVGVFAAERVSVQLRLDDVGWHLKHVGCGVRDTTVGWCSNDAGDKVSSRTVVGFSTPLEPTLVESSQQFLAWPDMFMVAWLGNSFKLAMIAPKSGFAAQQWRLCV